MRHLGYTRVSTSSQDTQLQFDALVYTGVQERDVFADVTSGSRTAIERPGMKKALGLSHGRRYRGGPASRPALPVAALTGSLLAMATHGNQDGVLQNAGKPYSLDYTPTILFLGDESYFQDLAANAHLTGDQSGRGSMNETGNTPGQSWLWLFSLLYQIEPFKSSANADILVVSTMLVLSILLTLLPFIPGLQSLPLKFPSTG